MERQKPDYLAAFFGIVACSCAFFLFSQQRVGPMTRCQELAGRWELTATSQLTNEKMGSRDMFEAVLTLNATGRPHICFGYLEVPGQPERAVVLGDTNTTEGQLSLEGEKEGQSSLDLAYSMVDLGPVERGVDGRLLVGSYNGTSFGTGRVEITYSADAAFATFVNATGGQEFQAVGAQRVWKPAGRAPVMDKIFTGLMVFSVASVFGVVRGAIFPKKVRRH